MDIKAAGSAGATNSQLSEPDRNQIEPFLRAMGMKDAPVYWSPVWEPPMLPFQRTWLLEFHRRLAVVLENGGLRQESFLRLKSLYPDLIDTFTKTSAEFLPLTGGGLKPGVAPVGIPVVCGDQGAGGSIHERAAKPLILRGGCRTTYTGF